MCLNIKLFVRWNEILPSLCYKFEYKISKSFFLDFFLQLFAFDTANKFLTPKSGEEKKIRIPPSLVAGAFAGVSSTLCTYPLELIKTRLTIQVSP
jgi:hypothetical protein